jgi:hypothetical protein
VLALDPRIPRRHHLRLCWLEAGQVVTRLAAIAARTVGRRVLLRNGGIGTVTRVTSKGLTVTIPGILPEHIERWLD